MRGKQLDINNHTPRYRITPADAGKTLYSLSSCAVCADHPRGCGENTVTTISHTHNIGSPPRMRGKLFKPVDALMGLRITPADAGKTGGYRPKNPDGRDHPRGCGENSFYSIFKPVDAGSPPRMRGKH